MSKALLTERFFLDNLWRRSCGMEEKEHPDIIPLEVMRKTQWSHSFEELRLNRMVFGGYRYGLMVEKNSRDRAESMIRRLRKYQESGNIEYLIDVANLCQIEFDFPNHPNAHFRSIDDDNVHCKH